MQRLYRVSGEKGTATPLGAIGGDTRQLLELANKEIATLEKRLTLLESRAKALSEAVAVADDRLQKGDLSDRVRHSLEMRRQLQFDELQSIQS